MVPLVTPMAMLLNLMVVNLLELRAKKLQTRTCIWVRVCVYAN